jgi:hypothetical protein
MILHYDTGLRNWKQRLWNKMNFAWSTTFHSDLHPHVLEGWPRDVSHAFTELQSKWLAGASRKAVDVLRVIAPPHSLLPLHLRLQRWFQGCRKWRRCLQEAPVL